MLVRATKCARNIWHAMSQGDPGEENGLSDDPVPDQDFQSAWDRLFRSTANKQGIDRILLGSGSTTDISTLHPEPAKVFRLWQIYLDNVDPLLKVTHTPTLQGRLVEAIGDSTQILPGMEALMFGIYCVATQSLAEDDCQTMFSSTKEHLTTVYQFGCEQALLNCNFLRTRDRDCLTALFLYLASHTHLLFSLERVRLTKPFRYPLAPARIPGLSRPCLERPFASLNVWALIAKQPVLSALFSRQKCAGGSGGLWSYSMLASVSWPISSQSLWLPLGIARFRLM